MTTALAVSLALSPLIVVAVGALLLMLVEAFSTNPVHQGMPDPATGGMALGATAVLFAGAAFAGTLWMVGIDQVGDVSALAPWLIFDRFSLFFDMTLCLGGGLAALLAGGYLAEHRLDRGEFYMLVLFATLGAMILAAAGDALTLFLGLETMSIGVYAMTAFRRASARSAEGALKYFLLGSFAAAILLFGFALLYGATGHTDLAGIGASTRTVGGHSPLFIMGAVLVLVGMVFKVSAVPFHAWTPDAYEGAPTPATTFMAVAVKAAAFAMLLRVLTLSLGDAGWTSWGTGWPPVMATLAVLTMTVANLIAGRQESVKRMLAYSSIAHAGYLLIGVTALMTGPAQAEASVLYYLLGYTVSTAGAFGALIFCGSRGREAVSYEDLSGLGKRHPGPALAFALFLVSLAGVPPTAGFFGKWFVFKAAIEGGLYWLAVLGLINSVIGAYYYLRVLVYMYMREPAAGAPVAVPMRSGYVSAALIVSAILVLALGLTPTRYLDLAIGAATFGTG
ncbi:MAG TPA: NADH-quinone oxidoreductase subunit N [Polyangiaceae bacterium]|jgi:NADH-quinone oxidoreductase subunit N|nr:NADH-quinone oxidoreductase subunit N [Polyangiaceae bacterium]